MVSSPSRRRRGNRHRGHDRNGAVRRRQPQPCPVPPRNFVALNSAIAHLNDLAMKVRSFPPAALLCLPGCGMQSDKLNLRGSDSTAGLEIERKGEVLSFTLENPPQGNL